MLQFGLYDGNPKFDKSLKV